MTKKNIIIPSDFNPACICHLSSLIKHYPNESLNITFVHFMGLSDSIVDLLILDRRNRDYQHVSSSFLEECKLLKEQYQNIQIKTNFFYGSTTAIFKNYLEANEIDLIVTSNHFTHKKLTERSYDPNLLIKRCRINVIDLNDCTETEIENLDINYPTEDLVLEKA